MSFLALVVFSFAFMLIGLLPKIFFRQDGTYNLKWIVTAGPYFTMPLLLILTYAGGMDTAVSQTSGLYRALEVVALPFALASVGLMCFTLGTHRIPLALWHQDNDAPQSIVTYGAYARIRHPFYTSFLIALMGSVLIAPHLLTLAVLVYGFVVMTQTAQREERNLCASAFGDQYRDYMKRTGRFFPKFSYTTIALSREVADER